MFSDKACSLICRSLAVLCTYMYFLIFVVPAKTQTNWNRKSKDMVHPLRADEKFVIPNLSHHFVQIHSSHSWFWYGSDWALYDKFVASISVRISCGGWWILHRQSVPHQGIFHIIASDEINKFHWKTWRCKSWITSLRGWDNNERMWIICVVAPTKHYVR